MQYLIFNKAEPGHSGCARAYVWLRSGVDSGLDSGADSGDGSGVGCAVAVLDFSPRLPLHCKECPGA